MSAYELMAGDPYATPARVKTNKKKGADTMKKAKGSNIPRVTNINDLSTAKIIWHVVTRHKFLLAVTYGAIITALYIMQGLPVAINNIRG